MHQKLNNWELITIYFVHIYLLNIKYRNYRFNNISTVPPALLLHARVSNVIDYSLMQNDMQLSIIIFISCNFAGLCVNGKT